MAVWRITLGPTQEVHLSYRDTRGEQRCGHSDACLYDDVLAFAADQADVFDRVVLPSGVVLVRQRSPSVPV